MATFLITGGAGFIGSHIADELIKKKQRVVILDNLESGSLKNLKKVITKIKFIKGDIRHRETVSEAMRSIDFVLHQAALTSVPESLLRPEAYAETNITGTINVLQAAFERNIKRVVCASSCAIYGGVAQKPQRETDIPRPQSPYALTKLAGEYFCALYSELYKLPTVCLRYFNVYGSRQDVKSNYAAVVPIFAHKLLQSHRPTIFGDGNQKRDFVAVQDIVQANILAARSPRVQPGAVFNVASGQAVSLNRLYKEMQKVLGVKLKASFAPPRPGDIYYSGANISKIEKIGFATTLPWQTGIKSYLKKENENIS